MKFKKIVALFTIIALVVNMSMFATAENASPWWFICRCLWLNWQTQQQRKAVTSTYAEVKAYKRDSVTFTSGNDIYVRLRKFNSGTAVASVKRLYTNGEYSISYYQGADVVGDYYYLSAAFDDTPLYGATHAHARIYWAP